MSIDIDEVLSNLDRYEFDSGNTDVEYNEVQQPPAQYINSSYKINTTAFNNPKPKRYLSFNEGMRRFKNESGLISETFGNDTIYYQMNTTNSSFIKMHYYLKAKGTKNNKFHLILLDKDLSGIDPRDPNLPMFMKQKVFIECQRNFFYYIREVVKIQSQGGPYVSYILDPGNLALNFCFTLNLNIYQEQPRQTGKTVGAEAWYSWVYNFGSRNANMVFLNKKHDDAKRNLNDVKNIIEALPTYLRFDQAFGMDGKKLKGRNTVQYVQHKINFNKIEAIPMARNRTAAISLLRGRTITNCWLDEAAFFQYLEESLQNAMPALTRAFANCKQNGAPHGLCLTSTPGFLTEESGRFMFELKNNMTQFSELWYDFSLDQLTQTLNRNEKSVFVYIRTTYRQLGLGEDWLKEIIKQQNQKWVDIRREFLLEWATSSENCPFSQEQLRKVNRYVRSPKKQVYVNGYLFNIYDEYNPRMSPIVGVDVAAGYSRDSSAISIIDSSTTKLLADFNCNYINPVDLSQVIYKLITESMPNALVVIERNGVGTGALAKLIKSRIKHNLYYEVKERTTEERPDGIHINKKKQWTKVYGLDNTKNVREQLMDLLESRVEDHYDKFISPIISEELKNLEVKKNGKIDHSSNSHDDSTFSYLLALYPLYYGKNLKENWNIKIPSLKTAEDEAEEIFQDFSATENINIIQDVQIADNELINNQLKQMNDGTMSYQQFLNMEQEKNNMAMNEILNNPIGQKAYADKFNVPIESIKEQHEQYNMLYEINNFYKEE